jgi:hypothetical protein
MNLWEETKAMLRHYGKQWCDVRFVCGNAFRISKLNFERLAKETNYDCGYGAAEVATDLKLIGTNWWLSRWEYDGSEGWKFNTMPDIEHMPVKKVDRLSVQGTDYCGWRSLRELNEEETE